jgi:hypothetical protein
MHQLATTSSTSTPDLLVQVVEELHLQQLHSYGKRYTDMWGAVDVGQMVAHWSAGLRGFTPREIKRGMAALEHREWPPTLPEFKKLCRPPIDPTEAYHQAVSGLEARGKGEMGEWPHPAIYWAAALLKQDLLMQPYAQVRERWTAALKAQMERSEWAEIPMPRKELPAPGEARLSREGAAKMLDELGAVGITKSGCKVPDGKRWARKIIERVAGGDKSVPNISLKFAREALAIPAEA